MACTFYLLPDMAGQISGMSPRCSAGCASSTGVQLCLQGKASVDCIILLLSQHPGGYVHHSFWGSSKSPICRHVHALPMGHMNISQIVTGVFDCSLFVRFFFLQGILTLLVSLVTEGGRITIFFCVLSFY